MNLPEIYAERLRRLRRTMKETGVSGLWIGQPESRRYLSGFKADDPQINESSGRLFITGRKQYLLTDSRYTVQAEQEAGGYEIMLYQPDPIATLGRLLNKHRIDRLGVEADYLTVSVHQELRRRLKGVKLVSTTGLVEDLRTIKDDSEIRKMVRALRITETALTKTFSHMKPGMTEEEIARFLEETMLDLGAEGLAFESIVASGPNAALPHAVPTRRRIKESETIIFDCGARYQGYRADISRTIVLGRPLPWIKKIYSIVRRAQLNAIRAIKPGMNSKQADALARDIIEAEGFGPCFGHSLGHGVGLATHEAPTLSRLRSTVLEEGMVVTVEPGIYLEGRGGVRLEEMVLLKPGGVRLLNRDRTFYNFE